MIKYILNLRKRKFKKAQGGKKYESADPGTSPNFAPTVLHSSKPPAVKRWGFIVYNVEYIKKENKYAKKINIINKRI